MIINFIMLLINLGFRMLKTNSTFDDMSTRKKRHYILVLEFIDFFFYLTNIFFIFLIVFFIFLNNTIYSLIPEITFFFNDTFFFL